MELHQVADFLTLGLRPSISAIIISTIVALLCPLLLHLYLYRSRKLLHLPSVLLVGPSGAGKTALLTQFERSKAAPTYTSQRPLTIECSLPVAVDPSARYRSSHDTNVVTKKFLLCDTPGHGKLRHFALNSILQPAHLRGIIFVVDASTLTVDSAGTGGASGATNAVTTVADYLYDVLLVLQKRFTGSKSSLAPEMPVLIAANKSDLFTALPATLVQTTLEAEITRIRTTRAKALPDSGIDLDKGAGGDADDDAEWLGSRDENRFRFSQMAEFNVPIEIIAGHATGADEADVEKWWSWVAERLS